MAVVEPRYSRKFDKFLGQIVKIGDGIAIVRGLKKIRAGEVVTFKNQIKGLALSLLNQTVAIIVFGNEHELCEGDYVVRTGIVISVPVGKNLLGRAVNALGVPIDKLITQIQTTEVRLVDIKAPGILAREPVKSPMMTGLKAIDTMLPIGRGQRELIIGDRKTGKTTIGIDAIINQRPLLSTTKFLEKRNALFKTLSLNKEILDITKIFCIYVGVAQKRSSIGVIYQKLQKKKALNYTILVVAGASESAAFHYIAPYAGAAMGEYFRDNGLNALIIYDDLTKQATAYRQLSLLLRRPPGREAFPGDVFYLHSRLLERAAKIAPKLGGGSLTALPIIETFGGDVSAYIPTNVISITDGQIFLETKLFLEGVKPAIDVGNSVSRVGSAAQLQAMKFATGTLKLDLAQYREIATFAKFGAELDVASQFIIDRGHRLVEILKQYPNKPLRMGLQAIIVYLGVRGFFDNIKINDIQIVESGFLNFIKKNFSYLLINIERFGKFSPILEESLARCFYIFITILVLQKKIQYNLNINLSKLNFFKK